jgi:hypothetical protein
LCRSIIKSRDFCGLDPLFAGAAIKEYAGKIKKQQMAAGTALAAKRGERKKSSLKGASKQMAESMSEEQLEEFAKTERKKLPTKKT